jgi:Protein of unknown function (DUF1569)
MHEPHLLQLETYHIMLGRLEKLSPSSASVWGKMDVAQMMAHLAANLEMAMGEKRVTRNLIGRIFGSIAKRQTLTNGILRNSQTDPRVKISDRREFHTEQEGLRIQLERFVQRGEAGITRQPHPFFGRMTANEWARLQYVHLDHHLKQFGV